MSITDTAPATAGGASAGAVKNTGSAPAPPDHPVPLVILGIPFHDVTFDEAVAWAMNHIRTGRPGYIATANLDFVMQSRKDPELQRILLEADLVVADGVPLLWLSRLFGPPLRERVTGSDLTPRLAEACRNEGLTVFALGAAPGVAQTAMTRLQARFSGLQVASCFSPPQADLLDMDHAAILAQLNQARPDLLLVAFGAPKQEKWINMHFRQWQVPLAIGIGGTLDFLAGVQRRAPRLVQKLALEWLWRMLSNPRRLLGRYSANLLFLAREVGHLMRLARLPAAPADSAKGPRPQLSEDDQAVWLDFRPAATPNEITAFLQEVHSLTRTHSLVLNVQGVTRLSSLELGALVTLGKLCRRHQHRLLLWGVGAHLQPFLDAHRLNAYIGVVNNSDSLAGELRKLRRSAKPLTQMAAGILEIILPLELTAVNLEDFRAQVVQDWLKIQASGNFSGIRISATHLEFIDSAALGFLAGLKKQTREQELTMQVEGFQGAAKRALKLARLEKLLGV